MAEGKPGFFSELRRRRVLRIATTYIAVAWLATEITSFLLEQAGAPGWSIRLVAIVFVVGFPVSIALAWVLQRQPGGKLAIDSSAGQHKAVSLVVVLGIVATAGLSWLILPRIEDTPAIPDYQPLPNSVAILPFIDDKATPNERAVGETLYHALLQGLNRSRELTQVQLKLDSPPADLAAFGKRVRVGTLLSGRLQPVRGGLQVTLELLDVTANVARWSRTIDWDPTRIMETGTEIANEVLDSMALPQLSTDRFAGTDNRDAYDALLLGFRHQKAFNIAELRLAMDDFQRAINLDPDYVDAYLGLAQTIRLYLHLKSPAEEERQVLEERQLESVETALALDDNDAKTLSLLGLVTENRELQLQLYEKAMALDPGYGPNYFRLGLYRLQGGDAKEAERLIRRALEFSPMDANYHSDLADCLWQQERHEEALEEIRQSITLEPRNAVNYITLGIGAHQYGNFDESVYNLRVAYSMDPESGRVANFVATVYKDLGMWEEAVAWSERGLELSPTARWAWILAASIRNQMGDDVTAREYWLQVLELDPESRVALMETGSFDVANGQWETALERWRQAYPALVNVDEPLIDQGNMAIAFNFSYNLMEAGEKAWGRDVLGRCLEVALDLPMQVEIDYWLSQIYVLMEDREKTLDIMRNDKTGNPEEYLARQFDFLRDDPEFQELMQELEDMPVQDELAPQRERVLEMQHNGEMPPAPGIEFKP